MIRFILIVSISVLNIFLYLPSYAAAPFGFEIGHAKYDYIVNDNFSKRVQFRDTQMNPYTGGKVLVSQTPHHSDIQGLSSLKLIFDHQDRLAAVFMRIQKAGSLPQSGEYAGFFGVYGMLMEKYKMKAKDFDANKKSMRAAFQSGEVYIDMRAEQESNDFDLRYMSQNYLKSKKQFHNNPGYILLGRKTKNNVF
ncbi:MAG: hypothetical protein AAF621_05505 [Pseudomonadota bacterium]